MKKILLVANHYITIYNFRMELIRKLLEQGHEVVVACPQDEKNELFTDIGCKVVQTEMSRHGLNPIEDCKLVGRYKAVMREVQPDIVFGYTVKPNIYGAMAARSLSIPFVANITGLGTAIENGGIIQKVIVALYRVAFGKVKTIFFQNTENRQFFIDRKIRLDAHKMIPGSGVNLEKFALQSYPSDETTEFIFIARVRQEKGIDQYIETARHITKKYPNTKFHICGLCEHGYQEVVDQAVSDQCVVYHGLMDDIRPVLNRVHCTIHPTYYPEGLSNTLLESCATGRPIITTNRSGCREVLDDGVNGFLVQPKDTVDLIDKVEQFLAMPHEEKMKMGLAGRAKVEKEFDRNIVIQAYLNEL